MLVAVFADNASAAVLVLCAHRMGMHPRMARMAPS